MNSDFQESSVRPSPLWFVAELTYRCPLQCPYCSNPTNLNSFKNELTTEQWLNTFEQARKMGSVQLGLSGGEPLLRKDLEELVSGARELGFYSNLITTGIGLTEQRVSDLKKAGLDHIQISIQDKGTTAESFFKNTLDFEHKREVSRLVKAHGYPMVVNIVIHKHNIEHIGQLIESAVSAGADYIELANAQYYGWAFVNKQALIPTKAQIEKAEALAADYAKKYKGKTEVLYVIPDYYEGYPKPCMCGWGNISLTVAPNGDAMPCLAAHILPDITLPNVKDEDVASIWHDSEAFNKYRGEEWMKSPCASCDKRHEDFGGCRCQAYLLTGDARNADPVCHKSEHHYLITDIKPQKTQETIVMRNFKNADVFNTKDN